jgi:hypothetical protein
MVLLDAKANQSVKQVNQDTKMLDVSSVVPIGENQFRAAKIERVGAFIGEALCEKVGRAPERAR